MLPAFANTRQATQGRVVGLGAEHGPVSFRAATLLVGPRGACRLNVKQPKRRDSNNYRRNKKHVAVFPSFRSLNAG